MIFDACTSLFRWGLRVSVSLFSSVITKRCVLFNIQCLHLIHLLSWWISYWPKTQSHITCWQTLAIADRTYCCSTAELVCLDSGAMVIATMWHPNKERQTSAPDFKTCTASSGVTSDPDKPAFYNAQVIIEFIHRCLINLDSKRLLCLKCCLVIVRCLIKDFEARPSVTHLLEHPFIKQAHGKEETVQQQLAALIREQQEVGCKTRTK